MRCVKSECFTDDEDKLCDIILAETHQVICKDHLVSWEKRFKRRYREKDIKLEARERLLDALSPSSKAEQETFLEMAETLIRDRSDFEETVLNDFHEWKKK
jgi:hypothetical protein